MVNNFDREGTERQIGNPGGPGRHYKGWPWRNQGSEVTPSSCWRHITETSTALSALWSTAPTDGPKACRPVSRSSAGALLTAAYDPKEKEALSVAGTEQGIWVDIEVSQVRRPDGGNPLAGRTPSP